MKISYKINISPAVVDEIADELSFGLVTDEKINNLESEIRQNGTIELVHKDYFSKDVYARELHIPKGTVLTGKIHKFTNLNIMSKGDISVLMEDGTIKRVQAPFTIVSPPGTRRVAYAHEDTVWTTIHGTDKTDVDEIEEEFIAQTPAEYKLFCDELLKIGV